MDNYKTVDLGSCDIEFIVVYGEIYRNISYKSKEKPD